MTSQREKVLDERGITLEEGQKERKEGVETLVGQLSFGSHSERGHSKGKVLGHNRTWRKRQKENTSHRRAGCEYCLALPRGKRYRNEESF